MTFILIVMGFLAMAISASRKFKINIGDSIALSGSVLILVLYLLAIFADLRLISAISALFIILSVFLLLKKDKAEKAPFVANLKSFISDSLLILFLLTAILVTILTSKQVFSWWDDINFWSSDAKQLYFLNRFPGRYGNVSPEFGDYPPVTSLFKWVFLQLSPHAYKESFQFAGYFVLNLIFLMPLAGKMQEAVSKALYTQQPSSSQAICNNKGNTGLLSCNIIFSALCFIAAALLPGVFNGMIYYGTPADITMAIIYGALLVAIADKERIDTNFYYIRIALYTAVLLLTKSVGIEWGIFAIIFYLIFSKRSSKIIFSVLFSGGFYGSWLLFCLLNRRVAKLTGAGISMATGTYTAPANAFDKARYFTEGFWLWPMHSDSNITLDLSTGAIIVLILSFVLFLWKKDIFNKTETIRLLVFLCLTCLLTYGIIFLAHISIFQTENQYLDAYAMSLSIARYGCPFTLGSTYLLAFLFFDRLILLSMTDDSVAGSPASPHAKSESSLSCKKRFIYALIFILFIFLTADYSGVYRHLWGYRKSVEENLKYCYDMVGDDGRIIVSEVLKDDSLYGKRVLVFRDGHTSHRVHDTYISKEASPVALVYDSFFAESESSADISGKIASSHASCLYAEDNDMISAKLFAPLMEQGLEYSPGVIYKIENMNGETVLTLP